MKEAIKGANQMKSVLFTAAALIALAGSACASTIKPSQAAANEGQLVIVEGTATIHDDGAKSGKDVEIAGSDNSRMIAFIPMTSENEFPSADSLNGKLVDVSGVIQMDTGKPTIRLTRTSQLKLAAPTP
jgi:opacity protein-like surface antigen